MIRVLLLVVGLAACGHSPAAAVLHLSGTTMGTTWNAVVVGAPENSDAQALIQAAVDEVDRLMSTYRDDSEISLFNRAPAGPFHGFTDPSLEVIAAAIEIHALSAGAFDPTIGPLVRLWGFGPQRPGALPSDAEIRAATAHVGAQELSVGAEGSVDKGDPAMELDFSAIAKGYGVDRACNALLRAGCQRFLVEVGGEVRVAGLSATAQAWRIGIDLPKPGLLEQRELSSVLHMEVGAVATSGDYRNFREEGGQRYSHVIDPRSGRPVQHPLASATVIADDCMHADALATALMVLGPAAGLALIEGLEGVEASLLVHADGGFLEQRSSGYARYLPPTQEAEGSAPQAQD